MGLFDEIIRTVQEAMEEARSQATGQRGGRAPGPVAPSTARRLREDADAANRRIAEARAAAAQAKGAGQMLARAQPPAPATDRRAPPIAPPAIGRSGQAVAQRERAAAVAAAGQKSAAADRAVEAARAVRREQGRRALISSTGTVRLIAKLGDPQAVRDAFLLAEILRPPVSMRPR